MSEESKAPVAGEETNATPSVKTTETKAKVDVEVPDIKTLLKSGIQFGHETKRWNPKMEKFIYSDKNGIHIIDISQTAEKLKEACEFLANVSANGPVLFVGTKKQASTIIREEAIKAGAYFIDKRWAGGLLTNFPMVSLSLKKLLKLEEDFENGVEGRTKYEVSLMKKEWSRLDRLYSGVKQMQAKPTAMIVLDVKFEKNAINEAVGMGIPVVGIVDTNSDPDKVNYVIPANDDAIGSIRIVMDTLSKAILKGNKGNGIKHKLVDYSKVEIKITKQKEAEEDLEGVVSVVEEITERKSEPVQSSEPKSIKKGKVEAGLLNKSIKKSKSEKVTKSKK
jgi:small subunit ribosomal protein S2